MLNLATTHGIVTRIDTAETLSQAAEDLFHRAAYFSSEYVIRKVEAFAAAKRRRVLYVLSYPAAYVARYLHDGTRPDQPFVKFLEAENLPFVDLLAAHAEDYTRFRGTIEDYVAGFFIGHYNPRGNFFSAHAMKEKLVAQLEPKPLPYRPTPGILRKKKKSKAARANS